MTSAEPRDPGPPHPRDAGPPGPGLGAFLRTLLEDLSSTTVAPLPPLSRPRWLRWLPHFVLCWIALGIALAGMDQMSAQYRLGGGLAAVTGFAQGVAILLAMWRPVPAWWLSLSGAVVAAGVARSNMLAGIAHTEPDWPWSPSAIIGHAFVLLLLALRVPTRASMGVLALDALVTYVVEGVIGGSAFSSTGVLAVAVFVAVVLIGTALRGRREARTQLVEQTTLTAEERARRTLLEERSRIARELHDVVAHHMSVISIQAQVAPHLVKNPTKELKENLEGIRQNALEALTELRRVLGVLRSENPDDPYGLGAGTGATPDAPQPTLDRLETLVENSRRGGLFVRTEIRGNQVPLPPGVELSAYRIVQEALSNALRHAPGSIVMVQLTYYAGGLQARVVNSKGGSPALPSQGAGHGLLGMRERAAMLGGSVVATQTSDGGFAVDAYLPTTATAAADDNSTSTQEK